jgi:predicted esterase
VSSPRPPLIARLAATSALALGVASVTCAAPRPGPALPAGSLPAPAAPPARARPAAAEPPREPDVVAAEPARFAAGLPTNVRVPGDRSVEVAFGAIGDRRVIVYLHGVCGRIEAFRAWERAAVEHGTVVALRGDEPCEGTGRFRWGPDVAHIDARVRAAVRAVAVARGEPLDDAAVTVIGYSQGSLRAAALARRFPDRYRRVVLAAAPTTPSPAGLSGARTALVAGGLDRRQHLFEASRAFRAAGIAASYFELPGARHGEYGPDGERAMGEVLAWLDGDGG